MGCGLGSPGKEGFCPGLIVAPAFGSPGNWGFGFGSDTGFITDCAFIFLSFLDRSQFLGLKRISILDLDRCKSSTKKNGHIGGFIGIAYKQISP
jgi:hypothetical protein